MPHYAQLTGFRCWKNMKPKTHTTTPCTPEERLLLLAGWTLEAHGNFNWRSPDGLHVVPEQAALAFVRNSSPALAQDKEETTVSANASMGDGE